MERLEPLLVQALIPKLAVKALDVIFLHGPAGLDQDVFDAVAMRRGHEGPAGELRAAVGAYRLRVATEDSGTIKDSRDVLT